MNDNILISICIPAYKRTIFLRRLLDSIGIQTFKNFEVIVTDDSPNEEVGILCKEYATKFPIFYKKNAKALGTPANWNEAISIAKGEWIKLMHDDDWFYDEHSLGEFAGHASLEKKFVFSAYANVFENSRDEQNVFLANSWRKKIVDLPMTLMVENVIGPPSVTMVHRSIKEQYDVLMKWRVDIDFYIRVLMHEKKYLYIGKPLINVGISETQVTNSCLNVPEVELPEGLLLLLKYGTAPLKNIRVYDAWWRVLRNTGVRNLKQLEQHTPYKNWPEIIKRMVEDEAKIPQALLRTGALSKLAMSISYLKNKKYT